MAGAGKHITVANTGITSMWLRYVLPTIVLAKVYTGCTGVRSTHSGVWMMHGWWHGRCGCIWRGVMGKSQRSKGQCGERELAAELSRLLGVEVKRKLGAAREGGSDIDIPGFSIECKRQ